MVTYETHVIYKHCNTCIHLETMFPMKHNTLHVQKRAACTQIPKYVSSFYFEEIKHLTRPLLPSLMAHWRNLEWGQTLLQMAPVFFWEKCIMDHLLSRDTTTIKKPGLWHDAVHMRKQRKVEEAKSISTMKVCVLRRVLSLLFPLHLLLFLHVSVQGGSSKCWKLSMVLLQHKTGRVKNNFFNHQLYAFIHLHTHS